MIPPLGERYQGDEEVINLSEIVYINRQDGEQDKRIVDSAIAVISHDGTRRVFHLECQSSDDNSMMIRMIEYDTQIAIRHNRELSDGNIRIRMPESGILYLRSTDKTPDIMGITIEVPGNRSVSYEMPVVKLKSYDVDSIFEKELYLLIPFYLFNLEGLFDQITDGDEQAKTELREQISDLYERLKERTDEGQIDEYTKASIINLSKKVMNALTRSYGAVRKEVDHIMGTLRREALSQSIQIHPQPIGFLATIHPCPFQSIQILKLMSALSRLMLLSDSCGY